VGSPIQSFRSAVCRTAGFPRGSGLKTCPSVGEVARSDKPVVTDWWLNQVVALAEMNSDLTRKQTKDTEGEGEGIDGRWESAWPARCRTIHRPPIGGTLTRVVVRGSLSLSGWGRSLSVSIEGCMEMP